MIRLFPVLIILFLPTISAFGDPEVRNDCTEVPVSITDLQSIAESTDVKTMQDFLDHIPAGTLQSFTFVTNSQSLQRGDDPSLHPQPGDSIVNSLWPRVIRYSTDGNIVLSFVCDPKNPAYGEVEALFRDPATHLIKKKEFAFEKRDQLIPPSHRSDDDPSTCIRCHGTETVGGQQLLKLNWPEYFEWGGCHSDRGTVVYGSNDNNLNPDGFRVVYRLYSDKAQADCSDRQLRSAFQKEIRDYADFKKAQANNPCFNSLPGFKNSSSTYPYFFDGKHLDALGAYKQSPNLHLTDVLTRNLAEQDAAVLKKSGARYDYLKYYLVMESLGCLNRSDREQIDKDLAGSTLFNKTDPSFPLPKAKEFQSRSFPNTLPILYNFARTAGLQPADFTLSFKENLNSNYNGGDNPVVARSIAAGILTDIAANNPVIGALAPTAEQSYIAKNYNPLLSCVQGTFGNIGGDNGTEIGNQASLCKALHRENEKNLPSARQKLLGEANSCVPPESSSALDEISALPAQAKLVAIKMDQESIDRGKKLVEADGKGKCVTCHSPGANKLPPGLQFIPSDFDPSHLQTDAKNKLKSKGAEGFAEKIRDEIDEMPPFANNLNAQDRDDIDSYLQSLMK
jgi:mono/diheme cytochrome c family protein